MAKISELPPLVEPTGNETVVVLDGGATKRVPIAGLASAAVAPQVARALAAQIAAEGAVSPFKAKLGADLSDVTTLVAGTTAPDSQTAGTPIFISEARTVRAGLPTEISLRIAGAGTGELALLAPVGDAFDLRVVRNLGVVTVAAGVNTFRLPADMPILPAGSVAVYKRLTGSQNLRDDPGGVGMRGIPITTALSEGAVITPGAVVSFTLAIALKILAAPAPIEGRLANAEAAVADVPDVKNKLGEPGRVTAAYGYSIDPQAPLKEVARGRTNYINRPLKAGDRFLGFEVTVTQAGGGSIIVSTPVYDASGALVQARPIAIYDVMLEVGTSFLAHTGDPAFPDSRYPAGSLVGFFCDTAILAYAETLAPEGPVYRHQSGKPVLAVAKAVDTLTYSPAIKARIDGIAAVAPRLAKVEQRVASLEQAGVGTSPQPLPIGAGKYPPFSPGNAYFRWLLKRARIERNITTAIGRIVMIGSSSVARAAMPQALADRLVPQLGLSGQGWLSVSGVAALSQPINGGTFARSAGWTQVEFAGQLGLDGFAVTTSAAGETLEWGNIPCRSFAIYSDDASGAYEYSIDGGASWTQVASGGTASRRKTVTPALASGAHRLIVRSVGAAPLRILGVYAPGTEKGVEISQAGHGGSDSLNWRAFFPGVAPILTEIDPDVVFIALTSNDMRANRSPSAFKTNMQEFVAGVRAAAPTAAVELFAQPDVSGTFAYDPAAYRDKMREISDADPMVEYYSGADVFADYTVMQPLGAFEDTLHPNELGSAALMRRYERERL
ncbi:MULTISPECIES: SGNH/GDSL hydrolase family protein [Sphingomonas]|uniref:SGNH/GDSL hydrolase family protein n=1 Tax=Sphingomonas TaxID=13687 RepID=UPI000F7DBECC|nr:SGNH/GDSL hydrolase family protein [Sphingomonas sp. ABOLF]RSV16255.1 SGNH/GDSL hydrolase family protein [Sphingomonas sp. ABOLF]GLK21488.1 hypothetical protein GCM10017606_23140 [Microbacterium terregens]